MHTWRCNVYTIRNFMYFIPSDNSVARNYPNNAINQTPIRNNGNPTMTTPRKRLIADAVYYVEQKCKKKNITADRDLIIKSLEETLGDNKIGESEMIVPDRLYVSDEVGLNLDGQPCRRLVISLLTKEHRIATRNWLLVSSAFFTDKPVDNVERLGGQIHEYDGPISELATTEILIGDQKHVDRDDVIGLYYNKSMTLITSFEMQDVFVIKKRYDKNVPVLYVYDIPDRNDDSRGTYECSSKRVPHTLDSFDAYWYYPAKPVKGWFGRIVGYERDSRFKPLAGKLTVSKQERDGYVYSQNVEITEEVANYLIRNSWSFNPLRLDQLPTC